MKKLVIIGILVLLSGITFGQTLQKGNLIGMHVMTINLDPDVTMNQFLDFYSSKVIPQIETNFPGWKAYLVKGIRGENENKFGVIFVVDSEGDRNRLFNEDGSNNELGKTIMQKIQPIMDESNQLGAWTSEYTDWLVQ
jgi:hypothetical protein